MPALPHDQLDPAMRSAIARLTESERVCLRRRLVPQTAKEMAIDLGISPHAVEKRLKMARAKLGVSSSLQAARLLAEAEGGVRTPVPRSSDLASSSSSAAPQGTGGTSREASRHRPFTHWRFVMITAIALGAVSFAYVAAFSPPLSGDAASLSPLQLIERDFADMDTDKSGFIDAADKSGMPQEVFVQFDANRDGKVTLAEMKSGTKGTFFFRSLDDPAPAGK